MVHCRSRRFPRILLRWVPGGYPNCRKDSRGGNLQMAQKLTKRVVDAVSPDDGRILVFDSELRGFGIRATPRGIMFFVQYRVGGGRAAAKKRYSIGRYGPLTVDQARAEARRILAGVSK